MSFEKNHQLPSNGYPTIPEIPLDQVVSGANETADYTAAGYVEKLKKPTIKRRIQKHRHIKDEESVSAAFSAWLFDHQIGISVNLLLLLFLTHISFPRARVYTTKFIYLSHYNAKSGKYGIGGDDAYLLSFWIVLLTGLRVAIMEYLLGPLAQMGGLKGKGKVRFSEQAWLIIYAGLSTAVGTYIMYHSDYWMDIPKVWANWPEREIPALFKLYYLVQFAFWIQQIVVVHIEERRKDHWQMFSHHVVTCGLMFWSYGYHHYKVGNVILVIMDSCDLALSTAKILKYLKYRTACDIAFGVFMVQWFALRHCAYLRICWSVVVDLPRYIPPACYPAPDSNIKGPLPLTGSWTTIFDAFRDPSGTLCHPSSLAHFFLSMLIMLQILLAIWFYMIINVAYKVITGVGAEDTRSDDEEEEEEDEAEDEKENVEQVYEPIEQEVEVEELHLNEKKRFKKHYSTSSTSGVSLPHDKELLGRIGCDKQNW